jgi:hypothetical protein
MHLPLSTDDDPCVLPLPDDALPLADHAPDGATPRALAVLALREQMSTLGLSLPLGPTLALDDPERLLLLNGFRVQLVCAPYGADTLSAASAPWHPAERAPHFLLAAWVEEDPRVVWMPGVLTHHEVIAQATAAGPDGVITLGVERFQGGVDRLLTLACLMTPDALSSPPTRAEVERGPEPLPVARWLRGWIDDSLLALGAQLAPLGGAGFRSAAPAEIDRSALAILAVPLGVVNDVLCWGESRTGAIERFHLQLIARGDSPAAASTLRVRLVPHLAGDVLPDGLRLVAGPRAAVSAVSQGLELEVSGSEAPIEIAVEWEGSRLRLPPLLLGPGDPSADPSPP